MKFLTALLLCLTVSYTQAQLVNCGLSTGTMGATDMAIQPGDPSPDPGYTGGPDSLSLNQYIFSYQDSLVTDTFTFTNGRQLFHANDDGSIVPSDFGLEHGSTFCVQYLHFDLDVLQEQIDVLFADSAFGVPCCAFAELTQGIDVCSIMIALGIDEGSDIADGNGLIDFAGAYGIAPSFEALGFLLDSVLNFAGSGGGPCLATGLPICYAISAPVCFTVDSTAGISAINTVSGRNNISLSPNPARDQTTLEFFGTFAGTAELNIIDLNGKLLRSEYIFLSRGKNTLPINTSELPPGIYQLEIQAGERRFGKRMVVSN